MLMLVTGLLAVAFGLLFIRQGLGIVHWPRSLHARRSQLGVRGAIWRRSAR